MRAVIQRVNEARVVVEDEAVGEIGGGLLVLLGVGQDDAEADADYLAQKVVGLRIFPDAEGKMNRSVLDVTGGVMVISQFTLYGDVRRGKRPSFTRAAPPDRADALYEHFASCLRQEGVPVATGRFGAMMQVELVNDGPVTILLDSERRF